MKNTKIVIFLFIAVAFFSCYKKKSGEKPVARVYDKVLYESDLREVVGNEINKQDSALKASNFIDLWVKKQLMIAKAELYLSEEQKDVEKQLEDYRNSLLMYKYKQKFIEQKLDTVIKNNEIDEYYLAHSLEFKLNNNAIKGLVVKVLKGNSEVSKIRNLIKSENQVDSAELYDYCKNNATKLDDFRNRWVYFKDVINQLDFTVENQADFLKTKKNIETEDADFYYFVKIEEYKLTGDIAPLDFMKNDIKNILLNKRKQLLINELEQNIYQNAVNEGNIEFFNE